MEIVKKLRCSRGEVALHLAVIVLVGVFLLSVILDVYAAYTIVRQVTEKTGEAVLAVAAANVAEVWNGTREGVGTARQYTDGGWTADVATSDVIIKLLQTLDVRQNGDALAKIRGTRNVFRLLDLDTRCINQVDDAANFLTTVAVEIPLSVGGGLLPPIRIPLEVHTTYDAKF